MKSASDMQSTVVSEYGDIEKGIQDDKSETGDFRGRVVRPEQDIAR